MSKVLFIFLIPLIVLGLMFLVFTKKFTLQVAPGIKTIYLKNQPIRVEIADTEALRAKGLSGRKSLAQDEGMLFIFQSPSRYTFWMKDMHFPLDFIWINKDTVVDITENVSPPVDFGSSALPRYKPLEPVDKVLEVNAGIVESSNIQIGDKVLIK